jgi:hypothetical protein
MPQSINTALSPLDSNELLCTLLEILGYTRNDEGIANDDARDSLVTLIEFLGNSNSQTDPESSLKAAMAFIGSLHPRMPFRTASDPSRIIAEVMALFQAGLASHLSMEIKTLLTQLLLLAGLPHGGSKKFPFQVFAAPGDEIPAATDFVCGVGAWRLDTDVNPKLNSWLVLPTPREVIADKTNNIKGLKFWVLLPSSFQDCQFSAWIQAGRLFDRLRNSAWSLVVESTLPNEVTPNSKTFQRSRIMPVLLSGNERIYSFKFKSDSQNIEGVEEFGPPDEWDTEFQEAYKEIACQGSLRGVLTCTFPDFEEGDHDLEGDAEKVRILSNVVEATPKNPNGGEFRFPKTKEQVDLEKGQKIIALGDFPENSSESDVNQLIFGEAPRFFRHQSRPVTVQDWEDIVQDCDDRIALAVVREGYCREGSRFGKGVHVSFLPRDLSWTCGGGSGLAINNSDLDSLHSAVINLVTKVKNTLEQVRPMGVLFEIWPARFIPSSITIDDHCFDASENDERVLRNLRGMCSIELMKGNPRSRGVTSFVQHACFAFKLRNRPDSALRDFCNNHFFSQDHLSVPFVLTSKTIDFKQDRERGIQLEVKNTDQFTKNVWYFPLIEKILKTPEVPRG